MKPLGVTAVTVVTAAVLTLAACSATPPDPGPRFNDEGQRDTTCMVHQTAAPGPRYTDAAIRETDDTLLLLRYYTANASKPYCDGEASTSADRAWATLYVDLGADRTNVEPLLR
jgi:hypothetical protein